ncbi:MAG: GDSL-type esterase/lipase family protein [Deltaproteobacteria bacterium]
MRFSRWSNTRWMATAILTAVLLAGAQTATAQENFYLKNGDRVVFYGDSITDQRLYTTFVETYVITRFPRLDVQFVHSGWGGDRVTGGGGGPIDLRLQRDVLPYRPTVMTIMLGMNDGGYRPYDAELFKTYSTGYEHILDFVSKALPDVRYTLIQPSPFDDVTRAPNFEGGYNAVLLRYSDFVRELAHRRRATLADMNTPVVQMLEKAKAADAKMAENIIRDRVHPGPGGHLIMAEALLKAWNAPSLVTAVTLDAEGGRVTRSENTRVSDLKKGSSLTWTQADSALPMPLNTKDPVVALVLRSSDFVNALDQETLSVEGLTAARYTLKIDGEEVGTFSADELRAGINLATLPTPMARQAQSVHDLTVIHNNLHFARWRQLQVPLADNPLPHLQEAEDQIDRLEDEVIAQQRAAAQPVPRHYELIPQ